MATARLRTRIHLDAADRPWSGTGAITIQQTLAENEADVDGLIIKQDRDLVWIPLSKCEEVASELKRLSKRS